MIAAIIYLALLLGASDGSEVPLAMVYLAAMAGAAALAWFADRLSVVIGRRVMWAAFTVFFILGVLSPLPIGMLYLVATVLALVALARPRSGSDRPGRS